jgi:16S rRNA U1498 N3-methylase RsmE
VNLILFEKYELGKALPRRDERTVHLLKVLHKKTGAIFEAGILNGQRGLGKIEKINLDGSILVSLQITETPPPRLPIRLAVGFPRPVQIRRLLRDLSNLGVEAIDLVATELGEKSYRDTKLLNDGGARAALIEGAVQARDTTIPLLSVFSGLEEWLNDRPWEGGAVSTPPVFSDASPVRPPYAPRPSVHPVQETSLAGRLGAGLPPNSGSRSIPLLIAADNVRPEGSMSRISPTRRPIVLAIGAERGWSDRERDLLESAGFLRLSLGSRALRTETACTAAAIIAMEKIGELG